MVYVFLCLGTLLLFFGGNTVVKHAITLAKKLGFSTFLIGTTVVAFGTSIPELVVSVDAALTNHPDVVIGNIIGSNLVNILFVLPLTGLFMSMAVSRSTLRREGLIVIGATFLFWGISLEGTINQFEALCLFLGFCLFLLYSFFGKKKEAPNLPLIPTNELSQGYLLLGLKLFCGFIFLSFGAHLFVESAVQIGHAWSVPESIIGLTVVAVGSAMPEIFIAILAAFGAHQDAILKHAIIIQADGDKDDIAAIRIKARMNVRDQPQFRRPQRAIPA